MYIKDGKRFNIENYDRNRFGRNPYYDPEYRAEQGILEIADPVVPEEFKDEFEAHPERYIVTEQDDAPYKVWTRRDEQSIIKHDETKAKNAAYQYLKDTDYLFTVDKYAQLAAERKTDLETKREEARLTIRNYEAKYPAGVL